jgi:hypothetical protein
MLNDIETGKEMEMQLKQMQHEILPTLNSPLIKCNYKLELAIQHDGLLAKKQDVPSLFFPITLVVDPMGPIDQIVNVAGNLPSAEPLMQA